MDASAEATAGGGGRGDADERGSLPREFSFRTTVNGNRDWGASDEEDKGGVGGSAEQRTAGLTSAAPLSPKAPTATAAAGNDKNFAEEAGGGEPPFSFYSPPRKSVVNMTSPVLAQAASPTPSGRPSDLHRRASSIPETLQAKASLGHLAGGEELAAAAATESSDESGQGLGGNGAGKAKRGWTSWSFRRSKNSEGNSPFLDEILGAARLITKGNKPKSPTYNEPSGELVGVSGELSTSAADSDDDHHEPIQPLVPLKRVPSYRNGTTSMSDPGPVKQVSPVSSKRFEPGRRRITILSMDGGGMRGLIAARCLAHLESLLQVKTGGPVRLCDYFDFLAGTSTGAILTLMITTPDEGGKPLFSGEGCCQFYAQNGRDIFRPRWYDPWRGSVRQLYRPKYSPRKFERLLKKYLVRNGKDLTMRDLLRPILVTSFDISRAAPHIFLSQAAAKDESRNFRLWEVCRGTASAPTYFRPAEVTSTDGKTTATLIDGGAIQNNPALVAMTHVLGNNEGFPEALGLQDVMILSLGAGQLDEKFDVKKARKWGMAGWVRPLLNIMMDGSSDTIDYQLAAGFAGHKCPENYLRIQLSGLPNKTALMDCSTKENIHDLIQFTDDLLQEKAVMRNEYGEKVTLAETYAERLSWFADQLIAQKKLRDQGEGGPNGHHASQNGGMGLGPTTPVISPLYGHLFMHHHLHGNGLSKPLETAKSVRF